MDIGDVITGILSAPFICIGWLIVGAVAGAVAGSIMGRTRSNLITNIILGLVGAVVGGFLFSLFDVNRPAGGVSALLVSLIVAIIGAVVLIAIARLLRGRPIR